MPEPEPESVEASAYGICDCMYHLFVLLDQLSFFFLLQLKSNRDYPFPLGLTELPQTRQHIHIRFLYPLYFQCHPLQDTETNSILATLQYLTFKSATTSAPVSPNS